MNTPDIFKNSEAQLTQKELNELVEILQFTQTYGEYITAGILSVDGDDDISKECQEAEYVINNDIPKYIERLNELRLPTVNDNIEKYLKRQHGELTPAQLKAVLSDIIDNL